MAQFVAPLPKDSKDVIGKLALKPLPLIKCYLFLCSVCNFIRSARKALFSSAVKLRQINRLGVNSVLCVGAGGCPGWSCCCGVVPGSTGEEQLEGDGLEVGPQWVRPAHLLFKQPPRDDVSSLAEIFFFKIM